MISDFERKNFENTIKPRRLDNIITIKNGVRDELVHYKTVKAFPQSFCYVGRIINYKGIRELIEAFEKISLNYSKAKLYIYGSGPDENKYRALTKNRNIIFCGYTKEPLLAIAKSEIFVLPSYYEGLSISLLEATMMKRAIIATDVDGNPEVIENGKTGILVPAKNTQELINAMQVLLDDSEFADKLAKNARQKYDSEFNFKNIVEEKLLPLFI